MAERSTTILKDLKAMSHLIDLTGKKFYRIKVLRRAEKIKSKYYSTYWVCQCRCGTIKKINSYHLRSGKTRSCGCIQREWARQKCQNSKTHGKHGTRIYEIWHGLRQRCLNKKSKYYRNYGGRGIKVCKRWNKFENFFKDVGSGYEKHKKKFGRKNTSLDRINNDGDYKPSNCRWATFAEQANNRRPRRVGPTYCNGCKINYPSLNAFHKNRTATFGYTSRCKKCLKIKRDLRELLRK